MIKISKTVIKGALAGVVALTISAFIHPFEGRKLKSYVDPAGIPTICDGATANVRLNQVATHQECDAMTRRDVEFAAQAVQSSVTVPISVETASALTSFVYNVGPNRFKKSSVLRHINQGNIALGCEKLSAYVCITVAKGRGDSSGPCKNDEQNKKFLRGLERRRTAEKQLCLKGAGL